MENFNSRKLKIPASVYRLQLSADFPIKSALNILPYLKDFGIEAIYCSPYFKSFSSQGYDVTDPNAFHPLLGTLEEYKTFCAKLKELELLHIADIVPNHMSIKGGQNRWWQDVLENGPFSEYASYFDINWSPEKPELQDRVLLPILSSAYVEALENQEIILSYEEGKFFLRYSDYLLPLAFHSYALILENDIEQLKRTYEEDDPEWKEYQALIQHYRLFPISGQEREAKKEEGREKLLIFFNHSKKIHKHILKQIQRFNGRKQKTASFDLLDKLLEAQFYRLSYWRVASHEINYRRFFNINELVSIHIENETVLENHHRWLFELVNEDQIQGIRIDHPDGLYDPVTYFHRLRQKIKVFTVVEKILEGKEKLPPDWEVEGTVGYDYLNVLNGIFVCQENEKTLTAIYEEFIGKKVDFEEILYRSKRFFTDYEMVSEVESLGLKLDRLSEKNREYRDFTRHELTKALAEVIACFPVYRSYINPQGEVSERDRHIIKIAIEKAKSCAYDLDVSIFEFLEKVLLTKARIRPEEEEAYRDFVLRFQQLTAPIMAKGMEDTAFYIYNRLLSLNEVGAEPAHFGHSIGEFHSHNLEKKEKWPYGFLATSTHDTKRSEDARMRLNVLSEMPERWNLELKKWSLINSKHKKGPIAANTEYFIYQTLIAAWPHGPLNSEELSVFTERIWKVILKSIREAKLETSWLYPNVEFEEMVHAFLLAILSEEHFLSQFTEFHQLIDRCGAWNSLSQVALKIGSPGVVDIYQGNECLTYRLVDPDNRSSVDFELRKKSLAQIKKEDLAHLFKAHELSKLKFLLQTKALHFRNKYKDLFLEGEYLPLKTEGVRKEHVIAFLRKKEDTFVVVLAGRFFSALDSDSPLGKHAWDDTEILLPEGWDELALTDLFTDKKIHVKKRGNTCSLVVSQVFEFLPFSYLF